MKLNEYLDQVESTQDEAFEIKNESQVNWALRKIKDYKDEMWRNEKIAEDEIKKITDWKESVDKSSQGQIDYFQGLLAKYALEKRDFNPDFKSLKLPNGTVRFKKQQPEFKYDDAVLVDYLKKEGETDLIKVKEAPNKTAIKKLFPIHDGKLINVGTGEAVEGVTVEYREDKFEVVTE